ncbi:MAG: hypothetical protein J0M24_21320 [Verrucomicrobia bacterium]|nr:hypothetical protein [Verrucomicrobiota bacterium]
MKDIIAKFRGGLRHDTLGAAAEVLCARFAGHLGFRTPEPFLVEVGRDFSESVPLEAKTLVERSLGLNFGSGYMGFGLTALPQELKLNRQQKKKAAAAFALDILIQNYDRKRDNPNMLWDGDEFYLIDHEAAIAPICEAETMGYQMLELDKFYDHVFFPTITPADAEFSEVYEALGGISGEVIDGWLSEIPESWLQGDSRVTLREYFLWLSENRGTILNLIRERIA